MGCALLATDCLIATSAGLYLGDCSLELRIRVRCTHRQCSSARVLGSSRTETALFKRRSASKRQFVSEPMFLESIGIGLAQPPDLPSLQHDTCDKFEAFNSYNDTPSSLDQGRTFWPWIADRGGGDGGNADPCIALSYTCCDRLVSGALGREEWRTLYQAS